MVLISLALSTLVHAHGLTDDMKADIEVNPLTFDQGSTLGQMLDYEKKISLPKSNAFQHNPLGLNATENRVLAIYGVGPSLSIDVIFQGQHFRFKQGVSKAVLHRSDGINAAPTLIKIKPPCVLLKFKSVKHHFCLEGILP